MLHVLIEQTLNEYQILYVKTSVKTNALSLLMCHLLSVCLSWVPHFLIWAEEVPPQYCFWNDSNVIKMHCKKIAIHSQIPWCKTLKAVYNVSLQIAFSVQCTLILCGSGRRYHFQYCRVLIRTANREWLSRKSSHGWILWEKHLWDCSCGSNRPSFLFFHPLLTC